MRVSIKEMINGTDLELLWNGEMAHVPRIGEEVVLFGRLVDLYDVKKVRWFPGDDLVIVMVTKAEG